MTIQLTSVSRRYGDGDGGVTALDGVSLGFGHRPVERPAPPVGAVRTQLPLARTRRDDSRLRPPRGRLGGTPGGPRPAQSLTHHQPTAHRNVTGTCKSPSRITPAGALSCGGVFTSAADLSQCDTLKIASQLPSDRFPTGHGQSHQNSQQCVSMSRSAYAARV